MKRRDPKGELARLPHGEKVRIVSRQGDSALVRRIRPGNPRQGTRAVSPIGNLKPARDAR